MNQLETYLRCVNLSKTICEAFGYVAKNTGAGKESSPMLADIQSGLNTILLKIPSLPGKGLEEFQSKTAALLRVCENFGNSGTGENYLCEKFNEWNRARISILYIEAINLADKYKNREEAAPLLEAILDDKAAAAFKPAIDFVLSEVLSKRQPLRAYQLAIRSFELNNRLFGSLLPENNPLHNYVYSPVKEIHFEHCPVCHGNGTPFYCAKQISAMDYDPSFSPVKLWMKCDSCGQIYTYTFPESFLKKVAEPQQEDEELEDNLCMQPKPHFLPLFGDILKKTASYTSGRKLLDVGVGGGELIAAALELGFDVEGVEISKRQVQEIKKMLRVEIHCTDFLDFNSSNQFDIITMGDVIEHVKDPIAAIEKAKTLLAENGVLWLSTPNFESGFSRIMGFRDPMWCEPYHITYFCYTGLKKLLLEHGFEVLDYSISRRYNGSMEIIAKRSRK